MLLRVLFPRQHKFNTYHISVLMGNLKSRYERAIFLSYWSPEQGVMLWNIIYNYICMIYVIAHLLVHLVLIEIGATDRSTLT